MKIKPLKIYVTGDFSDDKRMGRLESDLVHSLKPGQDLELTYSGADNGRSFKTVVLNPSRKGK